MPVSRAFSWNCLLNQRIIGLATLAIGWRKYYWSGLLGSLRFKLSELTGGDSYLHLSVGAIKLTAKCS